MSFTIEQLVKKLEEEGLTKWRVNAEGVANPEQYRLLRSPSYEVTADFLLRNRGSAVKNTFYCNNDNGTFLLELERYYDPQGNALENVSLRTQQSANNVNLYFRFTFAEDVAYVGDFMDMATFNAGILGALASGGEPGWDKLDEAGGSMDGMDQVGARINLEMAKERFVSVAKQFYTTMLRKKS